MEMIGKVRRMKLRDQLSNSEIAKRTGLSRNPVKKWLQAPGDEVPKYRREKGQTKLNEYGATLVQALRADAHRPKHARRTARALFAQLQAQGYRGGYSRLTDFIRAWREQEGKTAARGDSSCVQAVRFGWWPTPVRGTRCCLMHTRAALQRWAGWRTGTSTTT